jgi:Ca2+-binding RTX toxin-like protein
LAFAALLGGAGTAPSHAATVSVAAGGITLIDETGVDDVIELRVERDQVVVRGVAAGPGCSPGHWPGEVVCPTRSGDSVDVRLAEGADRLVGHTATDAACRAMTVDDGPGDDEIVMPSYGECVAAVRNGVGDDTLQGSVLRGGPGADVLSAITVDYSGASAPLSMSHSETPGRMKVTDGEPGGSDDVGFWTIVGSRFGDVVDLRRMEIPARWCCVRFELGAGDDTVRWGDVSAEFYGGPGNDLLMSGSEDRTIDRFRSGSTASGEGGDDRVAGGPWIDRLGGGPGRDRVEGGGGEDVLNGEDGDDVLRGGDASDALRGGPGADVVSGEGDGDFLLGEEGPDDIDGGDGVDLVGTEDWVYGPDLDEPGDDRVSGGPGDDTIVAGAGDDRVDGGPGHDRLDGSDGADALDGADGADLLDGSRGADRIGGGPGLDWVTYAEREERVQVSLDGAGTEGAAGEGDMIGADVERVRSGDGNDALVVPAVGGRAEAGEGHDHVVGGPGVQELLGEGGHDRLQGAGGNDVLDGGPGIDTGDWSDADGPVQADIGVALWIDAKVGTAANPIRELEAAIGGPHADVLRGGPGTQRLDGGPGNDLLDGGADGDVLIGGAGVDSVDYSPRATPITVTLGGGADDGSPGEGDDVGAVEHVAGGRAADRLVGTGAAELLRGNGGDDTIAAGGGADVVHGGAGTDTLDSGTGADIVGAADRDADRVVCGGEDDTVTADNADTLEGCPAKVGVRKAPAPRSAPRTRRRAIARAALASARSPRRVSGTSNADRLAGRAGADNIHGGLGPDRIDGRGGNDQLFGGTGSDLIRGGAGGDLLEGGEAPDRLEGGAGADQVLGQTGSDRVSGGSGGDAVDGGSGDDHVIGGAGDDSLFGRFGHDRMSGGPGADAIAGHEAPDTLNGGPGADVLEGGSGRDELLGADGPDTIAGGSGADSVVAGAGDDVVVVEHRDGPERAVDCGPGLDIIQVIVPTRTRPVSAARRFRDCERRQVIVETAPPTPTGITVFTGESGDARAGTGLADKLLGGPAGDIFLGDDGPDLLWGDHRPGTAAPDQLYAGAGADTVYGGGGADLVDGGDGDDFLQGDAGDDQVRGGAGNDTIRPAAGADTVDAGAGDDRIDALVDGADVIDCGRGRDTVRADRRDRLRGCEVVRRR